MSIQALIFKRVLTILKRWWERRQGWKQVNDAPPVKPPLRREVLREKPKYNRSIHSQPMKEEHEKRIENN